MDNDKWINQIFVDLKEFLKENLDNDEKEKLLLGTFKNISVDVDDIDKYFVNNDYQKLFFNFIKNLDYNIPHSIYMKIDISKMMQHALITL